MLLLGIASERILGQKYPLVYPDEEVETIFGQEYDDSVFEEDDLRAASTDRNVHAISDNDSSEVDVEDLVVRKDVDSHLGSNQNHGSSHNHDQPGSIHNREHGHGSVSGYGDHGFPASSNFGYGYPHTPHGYESSHTSGAYGYGGIQQPYYGLNSRFGYHPTSLGYPRVSSAVYGGYGSRTPFGRYGSHSHGRYGSKLAHVGYGSPYDGFGSSALYGSHGSRFARGYGSPYSGYGSRFGYGSPYGRSSSYGYASPYARFGSSSKNRGYGKLH